MISINNISLYFGGQDIFQDISLTVNKGDKIGLVGKNGAGKSTLLNLLSNNLTPNSGKISFPKGLTIGYLTQDIDFYDGCTVLDETKKAFNEVNQIKKEIDDLNNELADRKDYETDSYMQMISRLYDKQEELLMNGGEDIEVKINQVLLGLGFLQSDFKRQTNEFSGGWRMRIELAKILLKNPDIILLDEPTNHLDIESIIWLEDWLKKYNGAIILVSHDRKFLDNVTNRTVEISFRKLNDYKSTYSKYIFLREDRIKKQKQAKKNQDKYIEETKVLINKFRAKKNKAAFAQTLIRKLEKLDRIEVEQEDTAKMNFQFSPAPNSGKVSLRVKDVSKCYNDLQILKDINLEVANGEKIAFVGKNGEGKTTLAKIIVSSIDYEGTVKLGHNINLGYYAQNQSDFLDEDKSILQFIQDSADINTSSKVRDILGSFLFSNDDVDKKIKVLSGGERARVALCRLLLEPINLLIMDEPTNHLDMISKDILRRALESYDGTLILVSHDRDFLDGLTDKVYEFREMGIKEYIGDINTFLQERDLKDFKELENPAIIKDKKKKKKSKLSYNRKKEIRREERKLRNFISKLENKIGKLEEEIKALEKKLAIPEQFQKLSKEKDFFSNYENSQHKLKEIVSIWENAVQEFDDKKEYFLSGN
tara:strand:+ start:4128 stop:6077 length:1950 start_codon:yes stop_codon:yes gene_type:complete